MILVLHMGPLGHKFILLLRYLNKKTQKMSDSCILWNNFYKLTW